MISKDIHVYNGNNLAPRKEEKKNADQKHQQGAKKRDEIVGYHQAQRLIKQGPYISRFCFSKKIST